MTNSGYISPKLSRKSKDNYKSNLTENYCFYTNNEVLLFPNINNMQQRKQAYLEMKQVHIYFNVNPLNREPL